MNMLLVCQYDDPTAGKS